jgi:hypothetical protein
MNLLASANLIMGAWWPPTRSADQSRTRPRTTRPEDLFGLLAATTSVSSRVGSRVDTARKEPTLVVGQEA